MYKFFVTILLIFLSLNSCKKVIDFNNPNYYSILEVLNSKNCKGKCYKTPACENQIVSVKAMLDELNVFPEEQRFFILDENFIGNQKQIIEVKVSPNIAKKVFAKIENRKSANLEITGKLKSFDTQLDGKCLLLFNMILEKPNELNFK